MGEEWQGSWVAAQVAAKWQLACQMGECHMLPSGIHKAHFRELRKPCTSQMNIWCQRGRYKILLCGSWWIKSKYFFFTSRRTINKWNYQVWFSNEGDKNFYWNLKKEICLNEFILQDGYIQLPCSIHLLSRHSFSPIFILAAHFRSKLSPQVAIVE